MGPAIYIALILGSLAAIWIIILSVRLSGAKSALADEEKKSAKLAVLLASAKANLEAKRMTDEELLSDVSNILADL